MIFFVRYFPIFPNIFLTAMPQCWGEPYVCPQCRVSIVLIKWLSSSNSVSELFWQSIFSLAAGIGTYRYVLLFHLGRQNSFSFQLCLSGFFGPAAAATAPAAALTRRKWRHNCRCGSATEGSLFTFLITVIHRVIQSFFLISNHFANILGMYFFQTVSWYVYWGVRYRGWKWVPPEIR